MRALMKREALLGFSMLATMILFSQIALAGVGVSPSSVAFENMVRTGYSERYITVSNPTNDPVTVSVSMEGDISGWVTAEPSTFNMSGTGFKPVKIVARTPSSIPNGVYNGRMLIVAKPAPVSGETGNSMGAASVVAIDAYVRVSDAQLVKYKVESLTLPDTEECRPIFILASVRNLGNVNVTPRFHVEITERGGNNVVQQYDQTVQSLYPTTVADINMPVPYSTKQLKCLPAGEYTAKVVSYAESSIMDSSTLNFIIYPRGTLTVAGELMELKAPKNVTAGDVAKIEALFKNTGQVAVSAKLNVEAYPGGRMVDVVSGDPIEVRPNTIDMLTVYYTPRSGGKYKLLAYAAFEDKKSNSQEAEMDVTGSDYLLLIGAGIAIALGAGYVIFKRRKNQKRR